MVTHQCCQPLTDSLSSLPHCLPRLHTELAPYCSSSCQPQLVEVIADKNVNVRLRLADRTFRDLALPVNIPQALALLLAARQQWALQGLPVEQRPGLTELQQLQKQQESGQLGSSSGSSNSSGSLGDMQEAAGAAAATKCSYKGILGLFSYGKQQQDRPGSAVQQDLGDVGPAACSVSSSSAAASGFTSHAVNSMFGSDNRMGVPGTLHRISAMPDKAGSIYGLTYRVGRHVPGVALLLADVLSSMKASLGSDRPQSLLLLGQPGGQLTVAREGR